MKAFVCGAWDGNSVWVQWDDFAGRYRLQLRFRRPGSEWSEWQRVEELRGIEKSWMVVGVHKQDYECQVQIGNHDDPEAPWIPCQEVTFCRSRAWFSVENSGAVLQWAKDGIVIAMVDGAPCAYQLAEPVEVKTGVTEVELFSYGNEGWMQLDHPGHFFLQPRPGLVIRNLEPSRDDVEETGRDYTVITALPRTKRIIMAKTGMNYFAGLAGLPEVRS